MRLGRLTVLWMYFPVGPFPWAEVAAALIFLTCSTAVGFQLGCFFFKNLDSPGSVADPSGIKLTQKYIYISQMNVVAAYHMQKHLCSCLRQPSLCRVLLAPGIKNTVTMIHQDLQTVPIFSYLSAGVLFSGFVSGLFSVWSLYF